MRGVIARELISCVFCPVVTFNMNIVYELAERGFIILFRRVAACWGVPRSMISLMIFTFTIIKMIHWVLTTTVPMVKVFVLEHVTSHPFVAAHLEEVLYAGSTILLGLKYKTVFFTFLEVNTTYKNYKKLTAQVNDLKQEKKALQRSIKKLTKVEQALRGQIEALIA